MNTDIVQTKARSQFAHMLHASMEAPKPRPPRKDKPMPNADGSDAPVREQKAVTKSKFAGGPSDFSQKETNWSFTSLLDEACRVPEASKHVPNPNQPQWMLGSRFEVETRATDYHAQAKRKGGGAYQKTSPSMNAFVISIERDLIDAAPAYMKRALEHLIEELSERVIGAVYHDDETHPHMHVFAVPFDGEEFGAVHPGYGASRRVRRMTPVGTHGDGTMIRAAYTGAMVHWQDRFHAGTQIPEVKLERFGPHRKRLDRAVYKIHKGAAEAADIKAKATIEAARLKAAEMSGLAIELRDLAQAAQTEAAAAIAEAGLARTRNLAEARAVAGERDKLAVTTAGELAAMIAQLQVELAKERAAHMETTKALDGMKFRAQVVEDSKRVESVSVHVDANGHQIMAADFFDRSPERAMMRKPKPGVV